MSHPRYSRRQVIVASLAALPALGAPALARSLPSVKAIGGPAFGTRWSLTLSAAADSSTLLPTLEETLQSIDALMSPFRRDSAISAFNASAGTDWHPIDHQTASVARAALSLRHASDGAFDPRVGPLVGRWGFGPMPAAPVPGDARVMQEENTLRKSRPEATLDLCGIAKGYALDRMTELLRARGETDFVLDLGGEVAARGRHPSGRLWQIGIEDPRPGHDAPVGAVALQGRAIATSGLKVNGYTVGDRRYSHIIDPATQEPVQSSAASVSVIADTAMLADGWATALISAGANGPALAQRNRLDALFLFNEGASLKHVAVSRFDDYLT